MSRFRWSEFSRLGGVLRLCAFASALTAAFHPRAPRWNVEAVSSAGEITLEEALRLPQEQVLWVDARSRAAYAKGHIPGALLLNEEEWESLLGPFIEAWDSQPHIIVYCSSSQCRASASVVRRLGAELSIEKARVLHGGWEAWQTTRHVTTR
ncbi:MAG TPA: rhodanese-like domain-containing protein [Opitutaceae bacterium]|nr:rhodanese-like domain-containing protein [Opitutaceae bacterium]